MGEDSDTATDSRSVTFESDNLAACVLVRPSKAHLPTMFDLSLPFSFPGSDRNTSLGFFIQ